MEIAKRTRERNTVILAVMTLAVIGLTVLLYTNQTFRHQREAEEQHLFLTSRAVFLAIESSVRRGPVREGENRLSPRAADFFQALERDGDVLFVGIIDELGGNLLTSPLHGGKPIVLPDAMVDEMLKAGEWHGRLTVGDHGAYIYGKRLEPLRGMHVSLRDDLGPPGFLVVGIDMEKHLSVYAGFRKNVLLQALYILAAALVSWGLGVSFLARRDQAKRAAALERFQARLLDNLPDGLISFGPDGTVRAVNPAALRILKRGSAALLGRPARELSGELGFLTTAPDEPDRATQPEGQLVVGHLGGHLGGRAGEPPAEAWKQIRYEGAELEVLSLPISNDAETARLLILRDRTRLRNLEKSLADAEKLAAVGALAAGVAHEVRNPLSSLRGFAQYFVKRLAGRSPEEEYAKTMVREADRLNRVITDLLFLGRPKAINPRAVDLESLLRDISGLLRFDLERASVSMGLQLDAPVVFADEDNLKQALINLVLNSLDALSVRARTAHGKEREGPPPGPSGPESGPAPSALASAEPSASSTPSGPSTSSGPPALSGAPAAGTPLSEPEAALRVLSGRTPGGVWIEVRDRGCGMSAEKQALAFEAFFTDKENGTGLGLALVRRAMQDHGGSAAIASEPGKGCAVRLFFPHPPEEERNGEPAPQREAEGKRA